MSACLSDILLKVLNGSFKKLKPVHYVAVAPITLCFMIDDVQVNLYQNHLFSHQVTHNMTKYCSLIYQFST